MVVVMRMTATTMVGISSTGTHSWPMCGRGNGTPERYEYRYARYSFTSVLVTVRHPKFPTTTTTTTTKQINEHVVYNICIYTKAIIINYHVVLSDRWYIIIGTFYSLVICACVWCVRVFLQRCYLDTTTTSNMIIESVSRINHA